MRKGRFWMQPSGEKITERKEFQISLRYIAGIPIATFEGQITSEDIVYIQSILFADSNYQENPRVVFDISKAVFPNGSVDALRIAMNTFMIRPLDSRAYAGIVVSSQKHTEMVNVFSEVVRDLTIIVHCTNTVDEAIYWITEFSGM